MSSRRKATAPSKPGPAALEQPLTARSAIASLLLGMHPPKLQGALLVRWCGRLGIAEGTARVALSRMVGAGELRASDGGYELTGRLQSRQSTQDWSLAPRLRRWDGHWVLHVVGTAPRSAATRATLRAAAARARLAPVREGVWGRPDNLPAAATAADTVAVLETQTDRWRARPAAAPDATALFDLEVTASRATELLARVAGITAALESGDADLADAFVVGAATLQQVRRDPLLPRELLPADWPMDALRRAYGDYQQAFAWTVGAWFRSARGDRPRQATTQATTEPPAGPSASRGKATRASPVATEGGR